MRVKSFNMLEMDLDARVNAPITDPKTGRKCPIVKIVTTADGFYFDIGVMGAPEKVVYKKEMGEVWVYLPVKTAKLKISHPKYGQITTDTKDGYFWFPNARLEAGTCYRMELDVNRVNIEADDEERVKTGFVIIDSEPQGADVYIGTDENNQEYVGQTPFQKKYQYGRYIFSLRKNMYHKIQSFFELNDQRLQTTFPLEPAFGKLYITSTPRGARVTIDGIDGEFTTPFTSGNLASGEYTVRLTLDKYSPITKTVTIVDGQTSELNVAMDANFAPLTINSLPGAQISINGESVGTGSVTQELGEGIYDISVMLKSHREAKKQVEVVANQPQTLVLNPTPIYGSLEVVTTPYDADVTISGKSYGNTPLEINQLLVGDYDVVLSKQGCTTVTKHITIVEKQTSIIETSLQQLDRMNSSGNDSALQTIGETTFHGMGQGDTDSSIRLSPQMSPDLTDKQRAILGRLIRNMVRVVGGKFTMGATNEQYGVSRDNSRDIPAHTVKLSDYYIGKYEVTQAEWKAVMGKNPAKLNKGENSPVQNVSWEDCQEFIRKLSVLTGLQFMLPTEAQWEYAARGGTKSHGYKYSGSNDPDAVAWYENNAGYESKPVATKQPNELGLYDMSGNVREWCNDWYDTYSSDSQTDPSGAANGLCRVFRGGSYIDYLSWCSVSHRGLVEPGERYSNIGLRLVVNIY